MNNFGIENKAKIKLIIKTLAVAIILYVGIISTAPTRRLISLKKEVYADSTFRESHSFVLKNRELFNTSKDIALQQSQLVLADKDTFALLINLIDSTVNLMFNGVKMHSANIQNFEKDLFYNSINPIVYLQLFSKPLRILNEYSTIVKEPIISRKAPKDTLEAMNNSYIPDTLVQSPSYFRMELEHDITIHLIPYDAGSSNEKVLKKALKKYVVKSRIHNNLHNLLLWKKVKYTPNLVIYIRGDEIRSLYRALPSNAQLVLHY